jgi:hypothetical protein
MPRSRPWTSPAKLSGDTHGATSVHQQVREPEPQLLLVRRPARTLMAMTIARSLAPQSVHGSRRPWWPSLDGGEARTGCALPAATCAPHRAGSAELISLGVGTRAHQVAKRLVVLVGHPDRCQVPAAQQPSQCEDAPSVGPDPVVGAHGDQRGRHHHALHPKASQLAVQRVAGRTGLIGGDQPHLLPAQRSDQSPVACLALSRRRRLTSHGPRKHHLARQRNDGEAGSPMLPMVSATCP